MGKVPSAIKLVLRITLVFTVFYCLYAISREYKYVMMNDTLNYRISAEIISNNILCSPDVEAFNEKNGDNGPNCKDARKKMMTNYIILTMDIMLENFYKRIKPVLNLLYLMSWTLPYILGAIIIVGVLFFGKYILRYLSYKLDLDVLPGNCLDYEDVNEEKNPFKLE